MLVIVKHHYTVLCGSRLMERKEKQDKANMEKWEHFKKSVELQVEHEFGINDSAKTDLDRKISNIVWSKDDGKVGVDDSSIGTVNRRWKAAERVKESVYSINPVPGQGGRYRSTNNMSYSGSTSSSNNLHRKKSS